MRPLHAGLVGQQGVGILLDEGPCVGKAGLVVGAEVIEPCGVGVLNGVGGAHGEVAVFRPAQQGSCCDDRFQRAARNAGAPAEAGGKGSFGVLDGEDGVLVLVQIRGQLAGVCLCGGGGDAFAGSGVAAGRSRGAIGSGRAARQQTGEQGRAHQQGKDTVASHREDLLLSVPGGRPGKSLGYSSSILCRRAVVNWRVQDDFQPSLYKLHKLRHHFLPSGRIDNFCAGSYNSVIK